MRESAVAGAAAAGKMARAATGAKNACLLALADLLGERRSDILAANQADLEAARERGLPDPTAARLRFDEEKIASRRQALRDIAALPDPVGQPVSGQVTPVGLDVRRVRSPIGLILMIYEARPHVTINAGAFCLKSGNSCLLRGGSEVAQTNEVLAGLWRQAVEEGGLPADAVQVVSCSHDEVGELLAMDDLISLLIPRGGQKMVQAVAEQARMPVIKHEDGICHVFVDAGSDPAMAAAITTDSKCLMPAVCNALETLLVHQAAAETHLPAITASLRRQGVTLRGCERTRRVVDGIEEATEEDWSTEYLGLTLSIRVVDGLDAAVGHIAQYGSHHTDSIVTDSESRATRFLNEVDSAVTLVNASTMFDDGASLGLGAEIGISTGRLHARGPVGLEDLTIPRYVIRGQGQTMGEWPHG